MKTLGSSPLKPQELKFSLFLLACCKIPEAHQRIANTALESDKKEHMSKVEAGEEKGCDFKAQLAASHQQLEDQKKKHTLASGRAAPK